MKQVLFALVMVGLAAADPVPDNLDRTMIANTMAVMKPDIETCATKNKHTKDVIVKLRVKVAPAGTSTLRVDGEISDAFKACIEGVVSRNTFPETKYGGNFSYPFVF
ncbi:MAG: hypothetical protein QM831_02230 [Kofleriaceae bacterium]